MIMQALPDLFRFLFLFSLLFLILPGLLIRFGPELRQTSDRFYATLILSSVFFIGVVQALAFLKLYESFSLLAVCIAAWVVAVRRESKTKEISTGIQFMMSFFDFSDNPREWIPMLRRAGLRIKDILLRLYRNVISAIRAKPVFSLAILCIFGYAFIYRFHHPLTHLYFGASDPYVHLRWSKFMADNIMYADGIYPYGFEAVNSALSVFFQYDLFYVIRFIGALAGMLIVFSIYHALLGNEKNAPVDIAAGLMLYVGSMLLPSMAWRQISALPMEFAAVFILPGMVYFSRYLESPTRRYLWLASLCLLLNVWIHPYTAVALAAAYFVMALLHLRTLFKDKRWWRTLMFFAAGGMAGILPLLIAYLTGTEINDASVRYLTENIDSAQEGLVEKWLSFREPNAFLAVMVMMATGWLLLQGIGKILRRSWFVSSMTDRETLSVFLVFYILYRSDALGLPNLIPGDRMGMILSLSGTIAAAVLFRAVIRSIRWRAVVLSTAVVLLLISPYRAEIPSGNRYQHDASIEAYLSIKSQYPVQEWTIVSSIEEYPMVLGYGWHTNLWEFVYDVYGVNKERIEFDTPDIFLFVEKMPIGSDTSLMDEDGVKPIPELPDSQDLADHFYRNAENRRILQAKAQAWAKLYMQSHDNMEVYHESPYVVVYRIHRAADGLKNPLPTMSMLGGGEAI